MKELSRICIRPSFLEPQMMKEVMYISFITSDPGSSTGKACHTSHTIPMKKRQANESDSGLRVAYKRLNIFLNDSTYTLESGRETLYSSLTK